MYLNKIEWMVKWDTHSAYHHVSINDLHTDFLGFSLTYPGDTLFMKFVVLPFGLSTAPYTYTNPASILRKSTSGRHRPVSYPDGPMTARYRFT